MEPLIGRIKILKQKYLFPKVNLTDYRTKGINKWIKRNLSLNDVSSHMWNTWIFMFVLLEDFQRNSQFLTRSDFKTQHAPTLYKSALRCYALANKLELYGNPNAPMESMFPLLLQSSSTGPAHTGRCTGLVKVERGVVLCGIT